MEAKGAPPDPAISACEYPRVSRFKTDIEGAGRLTKKNSNLKAAASNDKSSSSGGGGGGGGGGNIGCKPTTTAANNNNKNAKFEIPSHASTPVSAPGDKRAVDSFHSFLKIFDENNDGRIDLDELVNISRYLTRKQQSIHVYKRLIAMLACILVFVALTNMGLTATAVYLYKDTYIESDDIGRRVMVGRSKKQAVKVYSTDSIVEQDALLGLESGQVVSTADFLDEKKLSLDMSDEDVMSITSARFPLPDGAEYACKVVGVRREFEPGGGSTVRAMYLSTLSGVEIEINAGSIIARGVEGLVQWQLPNSSNLSSSHAHARRLHQAGPDQPGASVYTCSAYHNANQRSSSSSSSEDSAIGLPTTAESDFTQSVQKLRADHAAEVRRYKETTTNMINTKNTEIDELLNQLESLGQLLG